jgi:hypothetical protein
VRIRLDVHIRTIVVLIGGKLTGIYIMYLLFVMTHFHQGKKVSILVPGNVNLGPVVSRRGLLDAVPIVR